MKTFEKWFEKYHDGRLCTVGGVAKDTWKAALEWVLQEADKEGAGEVIAVLQLTIKEELTSKN